MKEFRAFWLEGLVVAGLLGFGQFGLAAVAACVGIVGWRLNRNIQWVTCVVRAENAKRAAGHFARLYALCEKVGVTAQDIARQEEDYVRNGGAWAELKFAEDVMAAGTPGDLQVAGYMAQHRQANSKSLKDALEEAQRRGDPRTP